MLGRRAKVTRVMNAQAVGTTVINGAVLDMQGFEGVQFTALAGTITDGGFAIKAQQGTLADGSDMADLAGTATAESNTDDNKVLVLDVKRPKERYVRVVAVRAGATGAVIDGIVAQQYGPFSQPVTHDATVANAEYWVTPAEGTA